MRTLILFSMLALTAYARADVINYTDDDRQLWFDAVATLGDYNTIDFTGFPDATDINTQYQAEFGVVFTDGNDRARFSPFAYPNDDWGLDGNLSTTIVFDTPQNWFATEHPDVLVIRLYENDTLFYTSNLSGPLGIDGFNGVISDRAFDKVEVFDPTDSNVNMDDMYFGAIPAPSTLFHGLTPCKRCIRTY